MKFTLGKLFLTFKFTMFSSLAFNAIVRNTNANSFPFSFQVRWLKGPISIQFSDRNERLLITPKTTVQITVERICILILALDTIHNLSVIIMNKFIDQKL